MALTVRDLLDLNIMKNFRLIAGEGGLGRPISGNGVEVLDFEFVQGVGLHRDRLFEGESLAISSLLFAKDDPSQILDAVMRLYTMKVSGLAYKNVFIKELPEEVINFANANDFPILEFGGDEFFEDVIMQIRNELNRGSDMEEIERDLEKVLDREFTPKEELKFARRLNPNLKKYVRGVAIWDETRDPDEVENLVRRHLSSDRLRRKTALCKFHQGYFILLSQDEPEESRFSALLEDMLIELGLDRRTVKMGVSRVKPLEEEFGRAIRESFWACIVARLEKVEFRRYEELGIYRFVVPEINSPYMKAYMEEYLGPLMLEEHEELFNTAKTYVLCSGDVMKTAEALFCHKNTVRYRMSKIQELIDPKSNDKTFYESLSIALRIYMLSKFNRW